MGTFITQKEIHEKKINRITDVFYGIPGVQVRRVNSQEWGNALWDVTVHGADTQYFFGGESPPRSPRAEPIYDGSPSRTACRGCGRPVILPA